MSPFAAKPLTSLTVGETLRQARDHKNWSINDLAKDTIIHPRFIQALEEDRHQDLPGDVYVRHWLRQLCLKLKLDEEVIIKQWLDERQRRLTNQPLKILPAQTPVKKLIITAKQLRWLIIIIISLAVVTFLATRLYAVVSPPPLTIYNPAQDITHLYNEFSLAIDGQTAPEATVTINKQVISANLAGRFNQIISLRQGVNQITITAKKKHSLATSQQRTIVVDEQP